MAKPLAQRQKNDYNYKSWDTTHSSKYPSLSGVPQTTQSSAFSRSEHPEAIGIISTPRDPINNQKV